MRAPLAVLLLALGGCEFLTGRTPTEPPPVCRRAVAVTLRNAAGDSVGVSHVLELCPTEK